MSKLSLPSMPAEKSLSVLINAYRDYKKTQEIEITKREYIQANKEVCLERIRSQRAIIEQYLIGTFKERQQVITGMFNELDKGIESGNDQLINVAMSTIIATIQTSPLKGVKELFSDINNPDIECIEI